jgi:hypothetical protein
MEVLSPRFFVKGPTLLACLNEESGQDLVDMLL